MASAAVASGLRQHISRPSSHSHSLFLSSSLRSRHCKPRGPISLFPALSFPTSTCSRYPIPRPRLPFYPSVAGSRRLFSAPASASSPAHPSSRRISLEQEDDDDGEGDDEFDDASHNDDELVEEEEEEEMEGGGGEDPELHGQMEGLKCGSPAPQLPRHPSPKLSVKEKKELAALAHSLGKKLKCQQVGKSGVTPHVVAAFVETLEANELLKLKVHGSCPGELPEVIKQLEELTGSVAVGRIGRSVILYRPSLSKMQKKEAQAVRKTWKPRPKEPAYGLKMQTKRPVQRLSSRHSSERDHAGRM